MTLNNLSVFYKTQGRFAEAEPLFKRALAIFENAFGPKHAKVAVCRENYSDLLREMKAQAGKGRKMRAEK
jgi:Tetratricopeptide repeat